MTAPGEVGPDRPTEAFKRRSLNEFSFLILGFCGVVREIDRVASGGPYAEVHAAIVAVLLICFAGMVVNLRSRRRKAAS
jgi:hypothetical protein